MLKNYLIGCLLLLATSSGWAQIKGKVTDDFGKGFAGVNIYIANSPYGTTSNEQGDYFLEVTRPGTYQVHYEFIGYHAQSRSVTYQNEPITVNVLMPEEQFQLNEVVITKGEDPAYPIIREAMKHRQSNAARLTHYTADFYSRGSFKLIDTPKSFMGEKIDFNELLLDSTGTGYVYLSETVSKIHYAHPVLREQVVASKTAGDSKGYSYNTALAANFDFYQSTLKFNVPIVSPIASNAFQYYSYKFEGSFVDAHQHMINKIKVTPKRKNEPGVEGYIYIVDDFWTIYGVDFTINGKNLQMPGLDQFELKQNFTFYPAKQVWVKGTQTFDLKASIFLFNLEGSFTYVYSNVDLSTSDPALWKKNEIVKVLDDSNKKDSTYWSEQRKIPLSVAEESDYRKKDSVAIVRKSPAYLDSIQKENNKFKFANLIEYSYTHYQSKWRAGYSLISGFGFNAVQGYTVAPELFFSKLDDDYQSLWRIYAKTNYGFDEKQLRVSGGFRTKYNSQSMSVFEIKGGSELAQFNADAPITLLENGIASLFFKNNYIKLYERNFGQVSYGRELFNGLYAGLQVAYNDRRPVYLHSDKSVFKKDDVYQSNNPFDDANYTDAGFEKHQNVLANWLFNLRFGQKIISRPDYVSRVSNSKYPELSFALTHSLWSSASQYDFIRYEMRAKKDLDLGAYGSVKTQGLVGDFDAKDGMAFMDFKHFNGNQIHFDSQDRLNSFGLLPYYSRSTNDAYGEAHIVYSDLGYFTNKLPLIKWLKPHLNVAYHLSAVNGLQPYHEMQVGLSQLGYGVFKSLKVNYVYSQCGNVADHGVLFGFKFGI